MSDPEKKVPTPRLPRWVSSYVDLESVVGLSRRWIQELRRLPGAPRPQSNGKHSVKAWLEFAKANSSKVAKSADPDRRSLEAEKISLQLERLRFELDREKGAYIKLDEVIEGDHQIIQDAKQQFSNLPAILEARFPGMAAEAGTIGREVVADILKKLSEGYAK